MLKKTLYAGVILLVVILALLIDLKAAPAWHLTNFGTWLPKTLSAHPMPSALLLIALISIGYVLLNDSANPIRLALGEDGRLSTSKFQFLMWTIPVIFVTSALMFARKGQITSIPPNVMVALGFSLSTVVGAKGITVSYLAANRIQKPDDPEAVRDAAGNLASAPLHPGDLFQNDQGQPDLAKAQMLAWTVVAIADFLYNFFLHFACYATADTPALAAGAPCKPYAGNFPDIETTLMVLMGLGQGAYLGGKLVSTDPPQIDNVTATLQPGPSASVVVTLTGQNIAGAAVTINGVPPATSTWDPGGKTVTVTAPNPLAGKTIAVGDVLAVAGTINSVSFAKPVTVT